MKSDDTEITALYNKLLQITEKEQDEIVRNNLDEIETFWALKEELIKEIDRNGNGWGKSSDPELIAKAKSILKKIITANKANIQAIQRKKDGIMNEIIELQKRATVLNAYQANA